MKMQIKQLALKTLAFARTLDWRQVWQKAMPILITGVFFKALGG